MKYKLDLKEATMKCFPLPVVLVSCMDKDIPNIITITYVAGVNEEPPMIGIAVRPEGKPQGKYSHGLIARSREFVVNVPTPELLYDIDFCGNYSGRDTRKFEELGLTALQAECVKAPIIKECPINLECRLLQTVELPSHDFFIGKVVNLWVDKVTQKGLPDYNNLDFVFTTYMDYRDLGRKIGDACQIFMKDKKEYNRSLRQGE